MHRSQLAGFIIDCDCANLDAAAEFWSRALGLPMRRMTDPAEESYRRLETAEGGLHIEVQKVEHESRVHLDIETDDIEAEVRRLEGLGARRIAQIRSWWVLEAPTGQRFCVVRPQRAGFTESANCWD
jgi:predicted enzyme related to lactoylglutathione lyase